MDKLSSLNLTFDKIIIQLIIPGLVASMPWFLFYLSQDQIASDFFKTNITIAITVATFIALIVGLFLENFGGRLEVLWFDKRNLKKDPQYSVIWDKFLTLSYAKEEPVGQRYLRNILLRMKFELSLALAIVSMVLEFLILENVSNWVDSELLAYFLFYFLPLLITAYMLFEARSSSVILAKTRKLLVDKYA